MLDPTHSFVRNAGPAPDVLCLHSTACSSRQWEPLVEHLGTGFRTWAVDLAGHGERRRLEGVTHSLEREVALLKPLVAALAGRVHLVGHSYGGAVALRLALELPGRIASLSLYEPVMFRLLLDAEDPAGVEALDVANEIRSALAAGRGRDAARVFVDYWSGTGTYAALSEGAREALIARVPAVIDCFDALFLDTTTPRDLHRIEAPVLVMTGTASPAAGREASVRVAHALRDARWHVFNGLGHMAPIVRSQKVNAVVGEFLESVGGGEMSIAA